MVWSTQLLYISPEIIYLSLPLFISPYISLSLSKYSYLALYYSESVQHRGPPLSLPRHDIFIYISIHLSLFISQHLSLLIVNSISLALFSSESVHHRMWWCGLISLQTSLYIYIYIYLCLSLHLSVILLVNYA